MTLGTFDLWMLLYPWLIAPVAAMVAGGVTWALTRDETPDDGELIRHFVATMAVVALLAAGPLSSDWAHRLADPRIALREQLAAMPVNAALREHRPGDWTRVIQQAEPLIAGHPAPEALARHARQQQLPLARDMLVHSDDESALAYVDALLPVLRELHARDPKLCVGAAWPAARQPAVDLAAHVRPDTAQAYEHALIALISHARPPSPARPRPAAAAGSNPLQEMQRAYGEIRESLQATHGSALMADLHTAKVRQHDAARACEASIELLERAQALPPAMARRLTTSMLRG